MFIAALDMVTFVPIAIFAAFGAGAWVVIDLLVNNKSRTETRLEQLKGNRRGEAKSAVKSSAGFARMLEKASPALGKPFQPKTEKETSKLVQRLSAAGFRHEGAVAHFVTLKAICLIAGCVLGSGGFALTMGFGLNALLRMAGVALLSFFLPDVVLAFMGKRRKEQIFLGKLLIVQKFFLH